MDAIYVVSDQGSIKEEQWWAAFFLVRDRLIAVLTVFIITFTGSTNYLIRNQDAIAM